MHVVHTGKQAQPASAEISSVDFIYEIGVTWSVLHSAWERLICEVRYVGWASNFLASLPRAVDVIFGRSLPLMIQEIKLNTKVLSALSTVRSGQDHEAFVDPGLVWLVLEFGSCMVFEK